MTDSAIEIRERIRDDRVHYRDSILTLRESHIVMNALQALEAYEKQNAEIHHRAEVAQRALLWLCDMIMNDISVMVFPKTKTQVRNKKELYDYCIEQAEKELAKEE